MRIATIKSAGLVTAKKNILKGEAQMAFMKEIRFASKFWSIAEDFAAEILLFEHGVLLQKFT